MIKWYTHVNRNVIASNKKNGDTKPAVKFQKGKYGKPTYCFEVEFTGKSNVVYKPSGDPILPCGARLVIVTSEEPVVVA